MASNKNESHRSWKYVIIQKIVSLQTGDGGNNTVDFGTEVTNNTPSGYTFDHLDFLGYWPSLTWNNAFVVRAYNAATPTTKMNFMTLAAQDYILQAGIWYYKD